MDFNRKQTAYIAIIIALISGTILGAIGMYGYSSYHVFNSVASLEEAPFMQGFYMGMVSGFTVAFAHYEYPEVSTMEEFELAYDKEKATSDMNAIFSNSPIFKKSVDWVKKNYPEDGIYEWIKKSEERTRRGIWGFTV